MVNIVRSLLGLDEDDGKEIAKAVKKVKKIEKKQKKAKAKKPETKPEVKTPDPKPEEPSRYEEKELASKRVGDDE